MGLTILYRWTLLPGPLPGPLPASLSALPPEARLSTLPPEAVTLQTPVWCAMPAGPCCLDPCLDPCLPACLLCRTRSSPALPRRPSGVLRLFIWRFRPRLAVPGCPDNCCSRTLHPHSTLPRVPPGLPLCPSQPNKNRNSGESPRRALRSRDPGSGYGDGCFSTVVLGEALRQDVQTRAAPPALASLRQKIQSIT